MPEKQEVAKKKEWSTAVSSWTNTLTDLVTRDFANCGVPFDEYSKQCAMSAMTSIYQLVNSADKASMNDLDTSNLREIVGQCASLQLNANAVPRECYFQLRTKKINGNFVKIVEMGIEGDGNDALLRRHGADVKIVYPCWLIKEGDKYIPPKHKGLSLTAPEWEETATSNKVVRVVYPIELSNGTIQYLTADRDGVKTNLFTHVRNNLLNETFGICESRYKASEKQKEEIDNKKNEIYSALRECKTVEEMLACEIAKPYISAAWLDTPESMIIRKMRNNATKKHPKNFNSMAAQSMLEMDDTYKTSKEEIEENANSEDFPEDNVVADAEATEVVDGAVPEFMQEG